MRIKNNKKAQITVFMIIGIILLFSSALIFYIKNEVSTGIPENFVPAAEDVPLETRPVKIYVEDCMSRLLERAITQIGLHSGYLDPNDYEYTGKTFLTELEPTESDGLVFLKKQKSTLLPYWWYLSSENTCSGNCKLESLRPPLYKSEGEYSIEYQLDLYVQKNLHTCIKDFATFKTQGFDIKVLGNITPQTKVTEQNIVSVMNYPLEVSKGGSTTKIKNYYAKVDVNFKKIYQFATDITNLEIAAHFLELHTMNLIAAYSRPMSESKLPPIAEFTWDPGDYKIWITSDAKEKLELYVLPKVNQLQVQNSKNFKKKIIVNIDKDGKAILDYTAQGMATNLELIPNSSVNYSSIAAKFTYIDWWPSYLNINNNEVLTATSVSSDLLSFIGLNQYKFWYDVSYPVMVELSDPSAFNSKGFKFRFALESNIRDNNYTTSTYRLTDAGSPVGKLTCDLNKRNTGNITIEVIDIITNKPVNDSKVEFILGEQSCFIGKTKIDKNNRSSITTKFPVGAGLLKINVPGYQLYQQKLFLSLNKTMNKTIKLMPYKYINATIFTKSLSFLNHGKYMLPTSAPASPIMQGREKAIIILKRENNDGFKGYRAFIQATNMTSQVVKLLPGTYSVRGFLMHDSKERPIIIPKEKMIIDMPFFMEDEEIEFNASSYDQFQRGGITLDNETGYMNIDTNKLYNSNKIVFYVLRFPKPLTHSESLKNQPGIDQLSKLKLYSGQYKKELEPDWH